MSHVNLMMNATRFMSATDPSARTFAATVVAFAAGGTLIAGHMPPVALKATANHHVLVVAANEDWLSSLSDDTTAVLRLCDSENKRALLKRAVTIARQEYPPGSAVRVEAESDPEGDGAWVAVRVNTTAEVADTLAAHDRVQDRWMKEASGEAGRLFCFTFDFS